MIISVAVTAKPAPLDALVWVFGVVGGAAIILALAAMALAADHKIRRNAGRYQPALIALTRYLQDVDGNHTAGTQVSRSAESGALESPPADSGRALTTGDLIMDPVLLRHVAEIAAELKRIHRAPPPRQATPLSGL